MIRANPVATIAPQASARASNHPGSRSKESSQRKTGTTMHRGIAASRAISGSWTSPNCSPKVNPITTAPMPKRITSRPTTATMAGQSRGCDAGRGVEDMGTP